MSSVVRGDGIVRSQNLTRCCREIEQLITLPHMPVVNDGHLGAVVLRVQDSTDQNAHLREVQMMTRIDDVVDREERLVDTYLGTWRFYECAPASGAGDTRTELCWCVPPSRGRRL